MPHLAGDLDLLLRVLVAAALSAAMGWERERGKHSAGLRTHMLVGIAAALYVVLGNALVAGYEGPLASLRADPIRIIQGVSLGIGFLGGGVIFISRAEDRVKGLTTAASIWATAAVAMAAALQHYVLATAATLLILLVLRVFAVFDTADRPPPHAAD